MMVGGTSGGIGGVAGSSVRTKNSIMHFEKFSFLILLIFTLLTGYLFLSNLIIKPGLIDAEGRIVRWEGDYATIRFASPNMDSLTVKAKFSYTREKAALNSYTVIPVKYNPIAPTKFEIDRVRGNSLAGVLFMFLFMLVGLVSSTLNLLRKPQ